eukprot:1890324-Pleurochrysis_carterae.AAC.3
MWWQAEQCSVPKRLAAPVDATHAEQDERDGLQRHVDGAASQARLREPVRLAHGGGRLVERAACGVEGGGDGGCVESARRARLLSRLLVRARPVLVQEDAAVETARRVGCAHVEVAGGVVRLPVEVEEAIWARRGGGGEVEAGVRGVWFGAFGRRGET